ncbi:hypothetical protein TW89_1224 [Neisseria flavescens]|nr:hypothetical protein TW89_1224 [Neisseria flavescens]
MIHSRPSENQGFPWISDGLVYVLESKQIGVELPIFLAD